MIFRKIESVLKQINAHTHTHIDISINEIEKMRERALFSCFKHLKISI